MISKEQEQFEDLAKRAAKLMEDARKIRDEVRELPVSVGDPHRSHLAMLIVITILAGVVEAHFEFEARSCPPDDGEER